VSAFTSAKIDRILALQPDLAIGFSDMQADIAQALIKAGVEVWISNHRSVDGILGYVQRLGAMVGAAAKAEAYAAQLRARVDAVRERAARLPQRPRVYFEEWDEPQISAIRWVSELLGIAGGDDIFPERAVASLGRDRIVADPLEVVRAAPDIIIGSWCGKKFRPEKVVAARPGWADVPAVRDGALNEIKSPLILQPGPAALTDGLDALHAIVTRWSVRKMSAATKMPTIMKAITTFDTSPAMMPSQVATPTLSARPWSRCARYSPMAAPTSGMKSTPTMPMNRPATVPSTAPTMAWRLAPAFLAPSSPAT
jgi:iron complex transport system substrate-binding protein